MGLFDFLNIQWSAGKMTPEDRKKLFWYLKRKTSYTAWKREADAFATFAAVFKKQVVDEPHTKGPIDRTDWRFFYPGIIEAQVSYEEALARLLQGERSVWRYNEDGRLRYTQHSRHRQGNYSVWLYNKHRLLGDGETVLNSWYSELFNNGTRGDHFHDDNCLEEMMEAIKVFDMASGDSDYQQFTVGDGPALHWWGTEGVYCLLNKEPKQRKYKLAPLINCPNPLPEVPIAEKEVLIFTKKNIPVSGIYEPQVKDGCMNYLLRDTAAPLLAHGNRDPRSVHWRLVWEDTRYVDGIIPAEEALYFPTENKET